MRKKECNEQNNEEKIFPLTTSRKVYIEDFRLLRELSYISERKITQIFGDMQMRYKKKQFSLKQYNQATKHTSKSATAKSVKVPIDFHRYLQDRADQLNTTIKDLLSAMIQDYYKNFHNNNLNGGKCIGRIN